MDTSSLEKEISPSSKISKNLSYSKYKKEYTISYKNISPKNIDNNLNEKYLLIYDTIKNALNLTKKQNSIMRSKRRELSKKLTSYSHENKEKKYLEYNNSSQKPVKSLFNINKSPKRNIITKYEDTYYEWENNLIEKNNIKFFESLRNSFKNKSSRDSRDKRNK